MVVPEDWAMDRWGLMGNYRSKDLDLVDWVGRVFLGWQHRPYFSLGMIRGGKMMIFRSILDLMGGLLRRRVSGLLRVIWLVRRICRLVWARG
jgi:hypothetical protein